MDECTPKCRSRSHAQTVFSAITLAKEQEEKVLKYLQVVCHNVVSNRDPEGRSALHHAASLGRMKIIDWLVTNEAQTSLKDDESGYTALHRAAFFGRLNAVRFLSDKSSNPLLLDNDNLTYLDHFIRDRLPEHVLSRKQLSEAYVWGTNSNYTLGLSGQQSRDVPELLESFRKENVHIVQIVMSKFHSLFVTQSGQVYSCGHGHGGRLGQDTEHAIITPRRLKPIMKSSDPEVCVQAAVGTDHTLLLMESGTVWSCGMNQFHQLGHSPPPAQLLTPKCIASLSSKGKSVLIRGISASRYHSVFWCSNAVYTCGLNAGQLGHLKGDKTVIVPKQVTSLSAKELTITHVAASDGATAVCTHKGDVYVLHEYQCRKIASKQFELEKIVMVGGHLDPQAELLSEPVATKLRVVLLTKAGKIFVWSQSNPVLTRCLFRMGRQLIIRDVSLNNTSMLLVSQEGEAFSGTLVHRGNRRGEPSLPSTSAESRSWIEFAKTENCDQIKVTRVPGVCRAVAAASDPEGKNFAVVQNHPSVHMVNVPEICASQLQADFKQLIDEADPNDSIHDMIFQVGKQQFAAHRYVIASRQEAFYRQLCQSQLNGNESGVVSITGVSAEVFQLILEFIYAGSGSLLATGSARFQNLSAVHVTNGNLNARPAGKDVNDNRRRSGDKKHKKPEAQEVNVVKMVQNGAKKLDIDSLAKMLEKVKLVNARVVTLERVPSTDLSLDRASGKEFYDVRIRSEDGKEFDAHRVVLSARLEYFRAMFNCGWIETDSGRVLTLPVYSSVLEVVLDFLYTDRAPKIEKSDDVEWIGNVLVAADQLLISRLVSICESALVALLTLKNVGQIVEFADIYNAPQLKTACMHFICLNLPAVAEIRSWDVCSERLMDELTDYYRDQFHPVMAYRCITPSSLAPSLEKLESYLAADRSAEPTSMTALREEAKRQKARRKSARKSSECKERLLSTSSINSIESLEGEVLGPVEPVKRQTWSTVSKAKKVNKPAREEPIGGQFEEVAQPRKTQHTPTKSKNLSGPPEQQLSSPKQSFPTLYEVALVSQAANSPPKSQQSKKFPKLTQKQRKSQASASPSTPEAPVSITSPWKVAAATPSSCFADILKEDDSPLSPKAPVGSHPAPSDHTPLRHIMNSELEQKRNMVRMVTKPLKLTLIEEEAMDDLRRFYQVDDCFDEWITVERVPSGLVATPVWKVSHN